MSENLILGGGEASIAVARVAFLRMLRGSTVWIVLGVAALTVPLAFIQHTYNPDSGWQVVVETWAYLPAILVPVLLAGAIGEELEERTASYLWSRPLPRWSIVGGKLVALLPVLWIVLTASLILPGLMFGAQVTDNVGRLIGACVLGITGIAAVTAGLATVAPRFGTIVSLAYLVIIDRTLAFATGSVGKVSIGYHLLNLAGVHDAGQSVTESLIWLAGLSAAWMALAAWRIRRME